MKIRIIVSSFPPDPISSIVRLRIPLGDRPSLEEFRRQAAGRAELSPLMELMVRCWESGPGNRPSAFGTSSSSFLRAQRSSLSEDIE